jgi:hypothetical protein
MATYRIQRILWATHFAPARKIHGNPGPVYYPSIFLPGAYELPSGNRPGGIPVQRREGNQGIRRTGMAGCHVLPRAQQGLADGSLLRFL